MRQGVPRHPVAGLVQDGVDDLPEVGRGEPVLDPGRWEYGLDKAPLGVGQIGFI